MFYLKVQGEQSPLSPPQKPPLLSGGGYGLNRQCHRKNVQSRYKHRVLRGTGAGTLVREAE